MHRSWRDRDAFAKPSSGAAPASIADQQLLAGLWTLEHQLHAAIIRMDQYPHPDFKRYQRELRAVAVRVTGIRLAAAQELHIDPRKSGQEDMSDHA